MKYAIYKMYVQDVKICWIMIRDDLDYLIQILAMKDHLLMWEITKSNFWLTSCQLNFVICI